MLPRPVLLYDHDCGRCRRFAALARALNWGGRVEFAALDSPRAEALLPDLSRWERLSALRFVEPGGARHEAAEAVSALFASLPATGWAWRRLRRVVPGAAVRRAYAAAARGRACGGTA
jgi:predicted DCC family thiol-disulfide oxidoreductase YuxK